MTHKIKKIALIATIFVSPFTHGVLNQQLLEDLDLAIAADELRAQHDLNAVKAKGIIATVIARLIGDGAAKIVKDPIRSGLIISAFIALKPGLLSELTANAAPNEVEGITSLTEEKVVTAAGEFVAKAIIAAAQARLFEAAQKNESTSVLILISPRCNLDERHGEAGFSALHAASKCGFLRVAQDLVRSGANVNIEDNQGRSPLALARENGHAEIVTLLLNHGAKESEDKRQAEHMKLELEREDAVGPEEEITGGEEEKQEERAKSNQKSNAKKKSWWCWCS